MVVLLMLNYSECGQDNIRNAPNHILGNMNIALTLVSFTTYSGSTRHFDPPMQ